MVEFVLVMQNLWKVIDDILGKGYGLLDYLELLLYMSVVMIPLALPLTVLLSSVMIYGDMAEKYELTAIKSAGISLNRILGPGLAVAIFTMCFSLFSSNILKPDANQRFLKKMKDMKTNELTFVFDEKVFNREFQNYSIWIDKKEKDGRTVHGVRIYDHRDSDKSVLNMLYAESGEMYTTQDQKYLIMELDSGYQIKEIRSEAARQDQKSFNQPGRPVSRVYFSGIRKVFKLSELLNLNLNSISEKKLDVMNSWQLASLQDSLRDEITYKKERSMHHFGNLTKPYSKIAQDREEGNEDKDSNAPVSAQEKLNELKKPIPQRKSMPKTITSSKYKALFDVLEISPGDERIVDMLVPKQRRTVIDKAIKTATAMRDNTVNRGNEYRIKRASIKFAGLRLNQQFSWAAVCLIFLFIGGPAGAIVRKGGFGFPLLIAIGFYMVFIMTYITGEKLLKSGALESFTAAWLPCIILLPFAIILSYLALNDRNTTGFNLRSKIDSLIRLIKRT